jgi:hypothetical protein
MPTPNLPKILLERLGDAKIPADITAEGRPTALVVAVLSQSRNAVRLLLLYGADAALALDAAREVDDDALMELLRRSQKRSI